MAVSKVQKIDGTVIMDISQDNVNPNNLLQGGTAHGSDGEAVQGAVIVAPTDVTEVSDTTPYIYKPSEHDAVYDELVGGSVAWNQLVANSGSSLSVTITSGHKYVMKKSGTLSVGASGGSAITGLTGGTDWITDLTLMFGSTIADYAYNLEQSTAGSGIAWLKSYGFFTKDYYAYNAGGLISVNTSGKKVVSETTEITYPIQSTDLRGLYKLSGTKLYTDGDIYSADGTVTRKYGIVDLGTLAWQTASQSRFISSDIRSTVKPTHPSVAFNGVCQKYLAASNNDVYNHTIPNSMAITGYGDIVIYDVNYSSYADANAFKTAMSGVYLIYELATPTTAPAPPFTTPQMVYRSGTEEYLDTRDVPMPVGGNRKYVDIPDWMVNEYFDDCRTQLERAISDPETFCDSINALQTTGGTMTGDLIMNVGTTIKSNNGKNRLSVDNTQSYLYSTGIGSNTGLVDVWLSGNQPEILIRCEDSANNQYKYISLSLYSFRIKSNAIRWDGDNSALPTGTGTNLVIDSDGYFKKALSSRNVKHDINYVEDTNSYHDALMELKPATFVYNSDETETQKLGMIAEDVADVCPIAGMVDKNGKIENYDDRAIITMLVAEVQRLNKELEKLKGDKNEQE